LPTAAASARAREPLVSFSFPARQSADPLAFLGGQHEWLR